LQGQVVYDESFIAIDESPAALVDERAVTYEDERAVIYVLPAELPLQSWRYRYVKRAFDVIGALLLLTVFLIPGTIIALAILLTSPYPVFYSEERIGRGGVPFRIWKFRSMRPHATPHRIANPHSDRV